MRLFFQDIKLAMNKLRSNAGRSLIAVAILGLAFGVNAVVYTLRDNFYVGDTSNRADDVVLIGARFQDPSMNYFFMAEPVFMEPLERSVRSLQGLTRLSDYQVALTRVPHPLRGQGLRAGPGFEALWRMPVLRGRAFMASDYRADAERVVLLAERAWATAFGRSEQAVSSLVELNGIAHRVVGIFPDTFAFEHARYDVVSASTYREVGFAGLSYPHVWLAGRLAAGTTIGQAEAEVRRLESTLAGLVPADYFVENRLGVRRAGERSHTVSERQLRILAIAGLLILLTSALNLCGAALVEINQRRSEWATRIALGARRSHLVRLFATEMGLLLCAGYVLGLGLGYALVQIVRTRFTGAARGLLALLKPEDVHMSWRVFAVEALACLGLLLLLAFAALVAAHGLARQGQLAAVLSSDSRSASGSRAMRWTSNGLVFAQVVGTCVLAIFAGFFLTSAQRVSRYAYGYEFDGLVRASVFLPYYRYAGGESAVELVPLMNAVGEAVRAVPGVLDARLSRLEFPHWGEREGVRLRDTPPDASRDALPQARFGVVAPGMLELLGVRRLQGELFTPLHNRPDGERVVVVNQAFVQQHFRGGNALDQMVQVGERSYRVIGVSSDIRRWQIGSGRAQGQALTAPEPAIYFVQAQSAGRASAYLYLTAREWNGRLQQEIQDAVRRVATDIVLGQPQPLRALLARSESTLRLLVLMQTIVAVIGVLLSCLAIFSTVTHWVTQRRREIAIRLALGASPGHVGAGVVRYTALLVSTAVLLGVVVAYFGLRAGLLRSHLYLVSVQELHLYLWGALTLAGVGLAAALHPAVRAATVAPNVVLREG
jgi:predicted permease